MDTSSILEKGQNYFNKGLGFADQVLANAYIQKLKVFLPKPVKITMSLKNSYEQKGMESSFKDIANDVFDKTLLLGEFIKAYYKGEYRAIDNIKLALMFSAIIYIASPIDLIPDWVAFIGLFDEFVLIAWLLQTLYEELEKFEIWKNMQSTEAH